jgi:nucleoid DNA-binding protein
MQELIDRVASEAGISPEQAKKSIEAVAGFVKEKFPMMAGAVDQLFGANG